MKRTAAGSCTDGRRSASIRKKEVELDDGNRIPYDALCVAAGSSPFVPPFEGLDTVQKKFSFMTLDDALGAGKGADRKPRPDRRRGSDRPEMRGGDCRDARGITVFDLADRVLSSILDKECAAMMQKHLEQHGIRFFSEDSAVRFDGRNGRHEKRRRSRSMSWCLPSASAPIPHLSGRSAAK